MCYLHRPKVCFFGLSNVFSVYFDTVRKMCWNYDSSLDQIIPFTDTLYCLQIHSFVPLLTESNRFIIPIQPLFLLTVVYRVPLLNETQQALSPCMS